MIGKKSKKHNKIFNFIMFLLITIFLVSCTPTAPINNDTEIKNKKEEAQVIKEKESDNYYKLLLRFGYNNNPEPSVLFAKEDFLNIEKQINLDLNQNYDYIELKFQPLYYIGDYARNKDFAISEDTINQEIKIGLKTFNATDLKTMQIGERLQKHFSMEITDGRNFKPEDFIVSKENQTINVILGNNYINEYNLNDILNLELNTKDIELKIIGFLEKDTIFDVRDDHLILDDYIIMPFYNIEYPPNNEKEKIYQQIWYSLKNEGFIKPNEEETIDELKENIDVINKKHDLFFEIMELPIKFNLN